MIKLILGGIKIPNVPPAAKDPITIRSEYPRCRNDGSDTRLIVAEVATLDPEQAAKMAQDTMLVWIRPPGRKNIHLDMTRYIFSPIPLRFINSPIRTNRGTATRMKLVLDSHALFAMMFQRGASEKKNIMIKERHPNAAATYIPARKNAPISPNATPTATFNTL